MSTADMARLEATIHGRVQDVSFRYYTLLEAQRLRLQGWVANQPDGSVRAVAEGPEARLEDFLSFLKRGSPAAYVDGVDTTWAPATGTFTDFRVRH